MSPHLSKPHKPACKPPCWTILSHHQQQQLIDQLCQLIRKQLLRPDPILPAQPAQPAQPITPTPAGANTTKEVAHDLP